MFANVVAATLTNVNVLGNHSGNGVAGLFVVNTTLTITGCNINDNASGSNVGGLFANGTATIANTSISGNQAVNNEGGLEFSGTSLTLSNDTIANNTSAADSGGAFIQVTAGGSISNSTISGNSAAGAAGGLYLSNSSSGTPLTITGSTISNNHSGTDGGGIYDFSSGSAGVSLTNDTVYGNTASVNGGGIAHEGAGALLLNFVTVDGNASANGGGAYNTAGTFSVHSTIIGGNKANATKGPDVNGVFTTLGHNLISVQDAASTSFINAVNGDQVGSVGTPRHPALQPLENNGGPTFTQMLNPASTAINAADPVSPPSTDQRGFQRPGVGHALPTIGAFEPQSPAATGPSANGVYVENLYETLYNHTANGVSQATTYVNQLANGTTTPATVVLQIETTQEYRTALVRGLYQTYLHRAATSQELQAGLNTLNGGGTIEQVSVSIVDLPEYFQLHGSTNDAFVFAIINDVLGRVPTASELSSTVQALNSGLTTRMTVATNLFAGQEYRTDLVRSYFLQDLGRLPTAAESATYVTRLNLGIHDEVVNADLLGLPETFANRS
jgi:hypothetical protein